MEATAFSVVPALAVSRASLPDSVRLSATRPPLGSAQRRASTAGLAAPRCHRKASTRARVTLPRAQSDSQSSTETEKVLPMPASPTPMPGDSLYGRGRGGSPWPSGTLVPHILKRSVPLSF